MRSTRFTRRTISLTMLVATLIGVVPLSASASSEHTATRNTVSFTSALVEIVHHGEDWVDDAGIFHQRGLISREEIAGDINGMAVITQNDDIFVPGDCTDEACPHYADVWGEIEIASETGWWTGRWMLSFSDVPGDEYFFSSVTLHGRGGYAGMNFLGEFTELGDASVTIEGTLSTMALPVEGLSLKATVCMTDGGAGGSYLGTGAVEGHGSAEAVFIRSGNRWTHTYNQFGELRLSDESGSFTAGFLGGAQDVGESSHFFGNFVILEGTGAYVELYGAGRVVGAMIQLPQCESGLGVRLSLIGEAHYN